MFSLWNMKKFYVVRFRENERYRTFTILSIVRKITVKKYRVWLHKFFKKTQTYLDIDFSIGLDIILLYALFSSVHVFI